MHDVEPLIVEELGRLSVLDGAESGNWEEIVRRAVPVRRRRRLAAWTAAVLVVGIAVVIPALAFSGTLRNLVGLDEPQPRYEQARLQVEVRAPRRYRFGQNYVYRLWTAPSTQGGTCVFTTYDPLPAPPHPKQITGGGECSVGRHPLLMPSGHRFTWSIGSAPGDTFIVDGRAGPAAQIEQMRLRWHGGSQSITTHNGYFLGLVPIIHNPPFRLLPFDLVATNSNGQVIAQERIPTSFLYENWKQEEPKLTTYRQTHGCRKTPPIWQCRSR